MKVIFFSDVHLEFWKEEQLKDGVYIMGYRKEDLENCDLIIIAGDLNNICFSESANNLHFYKTFQRSEKFLEELLSYKKPLIMVAGNHEFYSSDYYFVLDYYTQLKQNKLKQGIDLYQNFYFLEKDFIDLKEHQTRIFGGTFWTGEVNLDKKTKEIKIEKNVHLSDNTLSENMNDYKKIVYLNSQISNEEKQHYLNAIPLYTENKINIKFDFKKLNFLKTQEFFQATLEKLKKASLTLPEDYKLWVVSHHLPTKNAIKTEEKQEFIKNPLNIFYYSQLEMFLIKNQIKPSHWFHGHWHKAPNQYQFETIKLEDYFSQKELEESNLNNLNTLIHTNTFGYIKEKLKEDGTTKIKKEKTNFKAKLLNLK